jgi:hypothetical protein
MAVNHKSASRLALGAVTVVVLAALFYQRASHNQAHVDFRNSNFFVFWLAGKMISSGQDPYNAVQWAAGHDMYGVTWRPNETFLYPLPLGFVVAPLALLPLQTAYFAWQLLSQVLIALVVWILLRDRPEARFQRLFLPLVVFLMFFGPVYLTLQVGALGAFTLLAVGTAILAWDTRASFAAGALLALTLLKPSQGVPIALLAAVWMVARRDWKGLLGLTGGTIALLVLGMLADPLWTVQFARSSRALLHETLGQQSNLISYAYLACGHGLTCTWILGGLASALVLSACGVLLWRWQCLLSPWESFNIIIPVAFVSTFYLWSYDQILYVIPIVWIAMVLLERTNSFVPPFVFVLVLVLISFIVLFRQASSQSDLWSLVTTGLIVGACAWLGFRSKHAPSGAS